MTRIDLVRRAEELIHGPGADGRLSSEAAYSLALEALADDTLTPQERRALREVAERFGDRMEEGVRRQLRMIADVPDRAVPELAASLRPPPKTHLPQSLAEASENIAADDVLGFDSYLFTLSLAFGGKDQLDGRDREALAAFVEKHGSQFESPRLRELLERAPTMSSHELRTWAKAARAYEKYQVEIGMRPPPRPGPRLAPTPPSIPGVGIGPRLDSGMRTSRPAFETPEMRLQQELQALFPRARRWDPPGPRIGSSAFTALLDRKTASTLRPGNRVEPLDGPQSLATRKALIDEASETISYQAWEWKDDEVGEELGTLLASKARDGVKVRLIVDTFKMDEEPAVFARMRAAGVEIRLRQHDSLATMNSSFHDKHLVVDGKAAVEGGMNTGGWYFGGDTFDLDLRLDGPSVADAQAAFVRNWEALGGELSEAERAQLFPKLARRAGGLPVRFIHNHPSNGERRIEEAFVRALESARHTFVMETPYFVPSGRVKQALMDAAKRGVDITIVTNGAEGGTSFELSNFAGRYHYNDLISAGVQIYETRDRTVHGKFASVDEALSLVGSANLNGRSMQQDTESIMMIHDARLARRLQGRIADDLGATNAAFQQPLSERRYMAVARWFMSEVLPIF